MDSQTVHILRQRIFCFKGVKTAGNILKEQRCSGHTVIVMVTGLRISEDLSNTLYMSNGKT